MKSFVKVAVLSISTLWCSALYANQIAPDFLKKEIKIAYSQYLSGSADTGLYALAALARILESDGSVSLHSNVGLNNLAFTYIRMGLLYEKSGNEQEAETYFKKGLNSYQGEKTDISKLKEIVLQLDRMNS